VNAPVSGSPSGLLILLPPSEGKAPGGRAPGWRPGSGRFGRQLAAQRLAVAEALAAAGGGHAKLLGVNGEHLVRAQAANAQLLGAPTLPAHQRFTGVVWDHIGIDTLAPAARQRASDSVVVVSALGGLSSFDDPLPDFRLKLSVSLPPLGRLSAHWRDRLSEVLAATAKGRLVVDLLPGEHAAAVELTGDGYDLVGVDLVDGAGRRVGHTAKAAKGRLVRALVQARSARAARTLLEGGWSYDGVAATVR
jgi:uncharacterized protein